MVIAITISRGPSIITYDRGTEFMAEFATMVKHDYGITVKAITTTTRNP
jgi:hypothetical protein